jgi:hypothetical protein
MSRISTGTSARPAICAARQRRSPAMISKRPALDRAHRDRLDQALGLDRGRQFLQRAGIHARARLVFARLQGRHRQRFLALRFGRVVGRQQGIEATAEAFLFRWVHGFSFQELTRSISSTAKAR